jgi:micrococcal nuclease
MRAITKRRAIKLLTSLIVLVILNFIYPYIQERLSGSKTPIPAGSYAVKEVYDGDTIGVDMAGVIERVRLIGVDTPETHKPNTPVQCYGPEASAFTKQRLLGAAVRLEADPTNDNRDRYNRLLRYVYTDTGELWNQTLIRQGYGFAYTSFPFTKKVQFLTEQFAAARDKTGIWGKCQPINSGDRWQSNTL